MVLHTVPANKVPAWTRTLPRYNLGCPIPGAFIIGPYVYWADDVAHVDDLLAAGQDEVRLTFRNGSLATFTDEDARFVRLFVETQESRKDCFP